MDPTNVGGHKGKCNEGEIGLEREKDFNPSFANFTKHMATCAHYWTFSSRGKGLWE